MMETCMVSRSCYVDSIILNKLLLLLTKYCNLKSKIDFLIHPKNKRKRLHVRRSSSFSSFKDLPETSKISLNLNFYPENQARNSSRSTSCSSSYDKCKYVYTIDQYWTLDTIFSSMIDRYKAKTWVRNYNTNPEAHICIVRQFWLDCYVCDQTF